MAITELVSAIHELAQTDELVTTPGMCRIAAERIKNAVAQLDHGATVTFLVYGSPQSEAVHYIPIIRVNGENMVANTVPVALFPEYIGPLEYAPFFPLLEQMSEVDEVI